MLYETTAIGNSRGRLDFAITAALADTDLAPELDEPSNIILFGKVKPSELDDNGAIVLGDVSEVDQQIRSRAAAAATAKWDTPPPDPPCSSGTLLQTLLLEFE